MDGRMKGPMDERMEGRMDECVQGRREKRRKGSKDERKNVWKDEGKNWYMDVGRKGRTKEWKEEGIDPTGERKGPEQSNIDPRIYKKEGRNQPKWCQNRPKRVPKRSQERQQITATSSRWSWTPPGERFPAYPVVAMDPSWVLKSRQMCKKSDAKNRWFFYRCWKQQKWEKGVQNHSKMKPKMVQNRAQKERQDENGKSVKSNNPPWF